MFTRWIPTSSVVMALAACLLPGVGDASATPAPKPRTLALGRVNMIAGSASGVVDVTVPREATFHLGVLPYRKRGPNASVEIEGAGRSVAVALVPRPPVPAALVGSGRFLISGRFGQCSERGCAPRDGVVNFQQPGTYAPGNDDARGTLAAGDYRLFLIADGEPVRVKLVLDGLDGRRRILPKAPAPVDLKTPTPHFAQLQGPSYFAAGDTFDGGERGIAVSMLSLRSAIDPVPSEYGMCGFYRTTVNLPDAVAYGPHCHATLAGGGAFGPWSDTDRFDVVFLQGYGDAGFPPTDLSRGHGVWFVSRNAVSDVTSHIFTLILE